MTKNPISTMLTTSAQREHGGRIAADRFDYQKNWVLCRILELHKSDKNYVVLCEYHEDVTELDDESDPKRVIFYQVKTDQAKAWTAGRMISRKKAKSKDSGSLPSILGKLCQKMALLPVGVASFRFVSNAAFSVRLGGADKSSKEVGAKLAALHSIDLNTIRDSLEAELGFKIDDEMIAQVELQCAELDLQDHSSTTAGRLASFVDSYANGCAVPVSPLYRTLFDEIRRRTNAPAPAGGMDTVVDKKGISRARMEGMLSDALRATPSDRTWNAIQAELLSDGVDLSTRLRLNTQFKGYYIRSLQPGGVTFHRLSRKLHRVASRILSENDSIGLYELALLSLKSGASTEDLNLAGLNADQAAILVMVELHERQIDEVPDASEQSEKGNV